MGVGRFGNLRWPVLADIEPELREYAPFQRFLLSIWAGSCEADRRAFIKELLELARIVEDQLVGLVDQDNVALANLKADIRVVSNRGLIAPVDPVVCKFLLVPPCSPLLGITMCTTLAIFEHRSMFAAPWIILLLPMAK